MSKKNAARRRGVYWQAISVFLAGALLASPTVNFAKSGAAPAVAVLSVDFARSNS